MSSRTIYTVVSMETNAVGLLAFEERATAVDYVAALEERFGPSARVFVVDTPLVQKEMEEE